MMICANSADSRSAKPLVHAQMPWLDAEPAQIPTRMGDLDVRARQLVSGFSVDRRDESELGELVNDRS